MARSLNSVQLIGNLTRDPELRNTQSGKSVCDIGLATSRQWKSESGEKKEETDFHKIVIWGKLGEICSQYLKKGQKAYFHGRMSTRKWTAQDGTEKQTTEIIADDMIMLSGGKDYGNNNDQSHYPDQAPESGGVPAASSQKVSNKAEAPSEAGQTEKEPRVDVDEIPF